MKAEYKNLRKLTLRLLLVLFDIFAVNFAYYMALVLRFYVNHEFHLAGTLFMPLFLKFAPYYTVCCIAVFATFKLYSGMWRYAGWNDVNRVAIACGVTCLIQIFGTLLFIRRMPITYYGLGALIQFTLICLSRFSYRVLAEEFSRANGRGNANINVMIVGAGETARTLLRQLATDKENLARPVCVLDPRSSEKGRLFDGLPVVGGLDELSEATKKYAVKSVIIADSLLPPETRKTVRERCGELQLSVQNFAGSVQTVSAGVSLSRLLELVNGPVDILLNGQELHFENAEEALAALPERYVVRGVSVKSNRLTAEIQRDNAANSIADAWVSAYEQETGEMISFF